MHQKVNSRSLLKLTARAAAKVNSGSCPLKLIAPLLKLTAGAAALKVLPPGTAANFSLRCTTEKLTAVRAQQFILVGNALLTRAGSTEIW
jgi:hypothetical protein